MPVKKHVIQQPVGTETQPCHNAVRNRLVHLLSPCLWKTHMHTQICRHTGTETKACSHTDTRKFCLESCCIDCGACVSHWIEVLSYPLMYGVQSITVLISVQSGKNDADAPQGIDGSWVPCVQIISFVSSIICCLSCCVQLYNFLFDLDKEYEQLAKLINQFN